MAQKKQWLLFDGRYRTDPDRATVMECCDSLKEAKRNCSDYGDDTVIVEYDLVKNELLNPKIIN